MTQSGGTVNRRWPNRHPADVTADRLVDQVTKWGDKLDGREKDDFSHVIFILREIAEGSR